MKLSVRYIVYSHGLTRSPRTNYLVQGEIFFSKWAVLSWSTFKILSHVMHIFQNWKLRRKHCLMINAKCWSKVKILTSSKQFSASVLINQLFFVGILIIGQRNSYYLKLNSKKFWDFFLGLIKIFSRDLGRVWRINSGSNKLAMS